MREPALKASAMPGYAIAATEKVLLININLLLIYFDDLLQLGSKTGIPSLMGYFLPHFEQRSHFLSFVYSKSALHRGQASMSNKSFGMGSPTLFCLFFGFVTILEPKALYITSYYFFINLITFIDIKHHWGSRG